LLSSGLEVEGELLRTEGRQKREGFAAKRVHRKMWARAFRLLGIVLVSVFLGYLIGSSTKPELVTAAPSSASGFLVSNLSIQPTEVQPNEIVTITILLANTHDTWGVYSLVLEINGVKEAETQAELDAGSSEDVTFTVEGAPG
jgi:hypothetical protein